MENNLEEQYREKFIQLKEDLTNQFNTYIAESIINKSIESPSLRAEIAVYKPIVESIMTALKESGIINKGHQSTTEEIDPEIVNVITEQTDVIKNQSHKIKELKMRLKLHEMISENLSGLNKDIIQAAITKFQGEDEMPEDQLIKELTHFINNRKAVSKTVQFESINDDIDEVSSILEGDSGKAKNGEFKPKRKISIPGLKKRLVAEAAEVTLPDDEPTELDPASEFLRDFGHLS